MSKNEDLPEKFQSGTSTIFKNALNDLIKGITGIAVSERKEIFLSVSNVFQKLLAGQRLKVVLEEWNKFKEKGRIKEDYQATEQHKACLSELLDYLDKEISDEIRFNV